MCRSNTASKVGELSLSNPSLGGVGGSNSLVVSTAISRLIYYYHHYIYVSAIEFGTNTSGMVRYSNPLGKLG